MRVRSQRWSCRIRVHAEDADLTTVTVQKPLHDLDHGRLPRPVRSEQGEDLTRARRRS